MTNSGSFNNFQKGKSGTPSQQRHNGLSRGSSKTQSQQPRGNFHQNNLSRKTDWKGPKASNFQRKNTAPKLSDKEKAELLASGSCFHCKKTGHMSRNCPQGNTVKSSSNNGKPPGLTNYSIELEPDLIDAEEALEIDSLDLGAINWQASGNIEWIEDEPSWMVYNPSLPRRTSLWDALALMSEYVLDIMQPYPGDCEALGNVGVRQRFSIYRTSNPDWYCINDHLSKNSCVIQTLNLENPNFRLGEWYS